MALLAQPGVLLPASIAFGTYGLRFVVFSAIAFFAGDPSRKPRWGFSCVERPANFNLAAQVRSELRRSLVMLCAITLLFTLLSASGLLDASLLYRTLGIYPLWWFFASIPVMLLLHDTFFYWLHRALHTRLLFELVHRPHHESVFTTAFTSYSFGWVEAVMEGLIVAVIIFVIPVHPAAFVIFQTIAIAYNVYGHSGRDFLPQSANDHWFWRWTNTSTLHAHHHRFAKGNYSLYFTFWDRMLKTLRHSPSNHSL